VKGSSLLLPSPYPVSVSCLRHPRLCLIHQARGQDPFFKPFEYIIGLPPCVTPGPKDTFLGPVAYLHWPTSKLLNQLAVTSFPLSLRTILKLEFILTVFHRFNFLELQWQGSTRIQDLWFSFSRYSQWAFADKHLSKLECKLECHSNFTWLSIDVIVV
jgi:hypothetical protein